MNLNPLFIISTNIPKRDLQGTHTEFLKVPVLSSRYFPNFVHKPQ